MSDPVPDALTRIRGALRIKNQSIEDFKENIIQKINAIILSLNDCEREGLTPAAESALNLTAEQLAEIIRQISDTSTLTDAEANRIVQPLRDDKNLRRRGGPRPTPRPTRSLLSRVFGAAPAAPAVPSASAGPAGPSVPPVPPVPSAGPEAPPSYSSVAPGQVKSGWSWPWTRGETVQPIKPTLSREEMERRAARTRRFTPNGPVPNEYVGDVIDNDEYVNGYSGRDPGRNTGRYGLFDEPLRTQQNHIGGWTPKRKPKRPRKTRKN